jgi:transcriptional regulator with XRE-family HTH domain
MDNTTAQPRWMPDRRRVRRTIREHGPDPTDLHFGQKLRGARLCARMSQEQLGAGIGVSFQAVQKYEQGENRLSASRLFRAARLLECQIGFFFAGLSSPRTDDQPALSAEEIALLRDFRHIVSHALRNNLLQVTRRLVETGPSAMQSS